MRDIIRVLYIVQHATWIVTKENYYKGTWELPKKITRSMAQELSAPPQYKKDVWELHRKKHQSLCKKVESAKKKRTKEANNPPKDSARRDDIQVSRVTEDRENKSKST